LSAFGTSVNRIIKEKGEGEGEGGDLVLEFKKHCFFFYF